MRQLLPASICSSVGEHLCDCRNWRDGL